MSSSAFIRRESNGVPFYSCRVLDELAFLRHGFSTRHGGTSPLPSATLNLSHVSWDAGARVEENRRRFLTVLGLPKESLVTLSQVHSNRVHIIEENPEQWNRRTQGDSLVTQRTGVTLAVQVADCFPVLITDPQTKTIASIHAGWRGTLARIVTRTVAKMHEKFGCDPSRLLVAIGPGIRSCCFEVGREVGEAFEKEFPGSKLAKPRGEKPDKYLVDLSRALDFQFKEAGLSWSHIFDLEACTRCNPGEFFSYRGEGPHSGRMMAVIATIQS